MTFELWTPPPLTVAIQECTDAQRKIARKCWDLAAVQHALAEGKLRVQLSTGAQTTLRDELGWSGDDLALFIQCLHKARYNDSEWCLPGGNNPKLQPMAADSYCMGFNRIKGGENQKADPWIYFKFTVRAGTLTLMVFSVHPERLIKE